MDIYVRTRFFWDTLYMYFFFTLLYYFYFYLFFFILFFSVLFMLSLSPSLFILVNDFAISIHYYCSISLLLTYTCWLANYPIVPKLIVLSSQGVGIVVTLFQPDLCVLGLTF